MKLKQIVQHTGTCTSLTHDGKGIMDYEGIPLYVENLLKGEVAKVTIDSDNDRYAFGHIDTLIKAHPSRVVAPCPHYGECGGCQLQHLNYQAQLETKRDRVFKLLKPVVRSLKKPPAIQGMTDPYHYRNKSQVPFMVTQGKLISGYYAPGTHRIIDMKECLLDQPEANEIIVSIRQLIKKFDLPLTDPRTRASWLTHVVVRTGLRTNQVMVIMITTTPRLPRAKDFVAQLRTQFPEITTIIHQVKDGDSRDIYGHTEFVLYGDGFIEEELNGLRFRLSSRSFFQVNTPQAEVMYAYAIEQANIQPEDTVIDAYCGVGTLTLLAAQKASQVVGVEIIHDAVESAQENARLNHITNVDFVVDDAIRFLRKWSQKGHTPDVIIVDPPRGGLEGDFVRSLLQISAKRIIYVSCDPSTLARDLFSLQKQYTVDAVKTFDLFGQTFHVETVVTLTKK